VLSRIPSTLPLEIDEVMTKVIGACIEVHRHLGPGFLETTYHQAVCIELAERGISFEKSKHVTLDYKGRKLKDQYIDLIVESSVVVELKAVSQLEEIHGSQVVSYLKATGLRAGLLVNFNHVVLKAGLRRIVR
jgi:GxxExxY protein